MRQVRLLESRYKVTVVGFGQKPDADIEFIGVSHKPAPLPAKMWRAFKLLLGLSESYYWNRHEVRSARSLLGEQKFDLVISNDIAALPLALLVAREAPVLMDAHEYSPREFEDKWWWRLLIGRYHHDLCKRYLPRAGGMITVCQGIADEYALNYGVAAEVVQNAPTSERLDPTKAEPGRIRLIHHGGAIRSRHIETMIEVMRHLDDRFTLDLMLVGNDIGYMTELRTRAAKDSRIRFVEPVPMPDICKALNGQYDMGIYLLPPVNFNHRYALPNKFFEFIQARLAVAIGPSPEMARLVKAYGFGVVAESFQPADLAALLSTVTEADLVRFKLAADVAAESLSYETGGRTLLSLVERLLVR